MTMPSVVNVLGINQDDQMIGVGGMEGEVAHLYSCVVTTPFGETHTVFVISSNETDAAGMARCSLGVATYDLPKHLKDQVKVEIRELPLTIQGYGKKKF